jgi:hypothetical protein
MRKYKKLYILKYKKDIADKWILLNKIKKFLK